MIGAEKKQDGQWYSFARHLVVLIRDRVSKMTSNLDFDRNFSDGTKNGFLSKLKVVFPGLLPYLYFPKFLRYILGTLWCGDGNVSDSVAVLGSAKFADSCCRDHDMCPDTIEAGDTQHGLTNKGLFTRSHCDCDDKFYNCLKKANTLISNGIGFTYFTILGPQCFQEDYPIIDCEDKQSK